MRKRVLLLAVSCKTGGLCPGGIDLDNPKKWIRIVRDNGYAGSVHGFEIGFAQPLDIIEFDGKHIPMGIQSENWSIEDNSCRKIGSVTLEDALPYLIGYGYHGYWSWRDVGFPEEGIQSKSYYLNETEFANVALRNIPSESILEVQDVRIYKSAYNGKALIDFRWRSYSQLGLESLSRFSPLTLFRFTPLTDPDYYPRLNAGEVIQIQHAFIVVALPKDMITLESGEKRAYKFVSKVFELA